MGSNRHAKTRIAGRSMDTTPPRNARPSRRQKIAAELPYLPPGRRAREGLSRLVGERFCQQIDDVPHLQIHARATHRRAELQRAAGIRGCDELGAARAHGGGLAHANPLRHRRLHQVEVSGAAAAELGILDRDESRARDRREEGTWGIANALRMREVTRIVVGDPSGGTRQCGGDLWALRELADGKVMLVIADATGHGAAPALLAAAAKGAIDASWQMRLNDLDPGSF